MTPRHGQSGFMLLEVVLSVGLLVLGLAVIGAQVQQSYYMAHETDQTARVVFLAESKLAEIDTGLIQPEKEIESDFGRLFPQYGWRLTMEPAGLPDMFLMTLQVLNDPQREVDQDFEFDTAKVMATYRLVKLAPRPLDLTTDFGMDEDTAANLNQQLANIGGDTTLDVHDFNPALFRDMDMDQIMQILPALMEAFGVNQSELLSMVPENLRPQVQQLFQAPPDDTGGASANGDTTGNSNSNSNSDASGNAADQNSNANGNTTGGSGDNEAAPSDNDPFGEGAEQGTNDQKQNQGRGTRQNSRRRPPRSGGG